VTGADACFVTDDQTWFWTPEWQAGEREADADVAAGRVEHFEDGEAFVASLRDEDRP
jgi:hypothetical protein